MLNLPVLSLGCAILLCRPGVTVAIWVGACMQAIDSARPCHPLPSGKPLLMLPRVNPPHSTAMTRPCEMPSFRHTNAS